MFSPFLPHFSRYSPPTALHEVLQTIASPIGNVVTVVLALAGALSFPFSTSEQATSRRLGHRLLALSIIVLFLRAYCKHELLTGVTRFSEFAAISWDICLALAFGVGILGVPLLLLGVWIAGCIPASIAACNSKAMRHLSHLFKQRNAEEVAAILVMISFLIFAWSPSVACLATFITGVAVVELSREMNVKYAVLQPPISFTLVVRPFIVAIALGLVWADTRLLW